MQPEGSIPTEITGFAIWKTRLREAVEANAAANSEIEGLWQLLRRTGIDAAQ